VKVVRNSQHIDKTATTAAAAAAATNLKLWAQLIVTLTFGLRSDELQK